MKYALSVKLGSKVQLYVSNMTIVPGVMYRLSNISYFPSIDFLVLQDDMYYGIQVSITSTCEKHDKYQSVTVLMDKVKHVIPEIDSMSYIYCNLEQSRSKDPSYYVPVSVPGYLLIEGKTALYDKLLRLAHL